MAEIVRLLRWRAEWDGADLTDGATKAAAAGERLKKTIEEVGTSAPAALKKVGTAASDAGTSFEGLGIEVNQVEGFLKNLERGTGSTTTLTRNAQQLEAAFNVLVQSAERAGQTIPQAFSDRVAQAIGNAKTQAEAMNSELEKVGLLPTKFDKVVTILEKTADSTKKAWTEFEKLGEEGERAASALRAMEAANNSPRELQRNAALAKLEMDELRASIDRMKASGQTIGPEVGQSLDRAEQKIAQANVRAAQLRDTMGDLKTRGDLAAKGFEAAAGAAGSLDGMLGQLKDTGSKTQQSMADIGFAVLATKTAFETGYTSGQKFVELMKELGITIPNVSSEMAELLVTLSGFAEGGERAKNATAALLDAVVAYLTGQRGVISALRELDQPENAALDRAREYTALREKQAAAERALRSAFAASGVSWKSGYQELEQLNLALADSELRLSRAGVSQKQYDTELKANGETYLKLRERAEYWGISLDKVAPRTSAAAQAAAELKEKQDALAGAIPAATAALSAQEEQMKMGEEAIKAAADAYQYWIDRQNQFITESGRVEEGMRKWRDATQGPNSPFGALSGDFTQIDQAVEGMLAAGGSLNRLQVGFSEIALSWQRSTEEMNRGLESVLSTLGRLDEKMISTLDTFEQFRSTMATAVDSFEKGTTSAAGLQAILNMLATQLTQNFGAAAGEAGAEIRKLIAAIQALIATGNMGPGGSLDPTLWGGLEREFGKGRK